MFPARIDLNADLGEGVGDDAAILPFLSSANVACGAYAGSSRTMDVALAAAAHHGVVVGAHVGYEDREHFGRAAMSLPREELRAAITQQIAKLQHLASRFGVAVRYVKPHGALYHRVGVDSEQAHALLDAVRICDTQLDLLVPYSAMLHSIAHPQRCKYEFFADRAYRLNGQLVDRTEPGAVITDIEMITTRTLHWLRSGEVVSIEGKTLRIEAQSICLHGDTPHALTIARTLHTTLSDAGIRIAHWADA